MNEKDETNKSVSKSFRFASKDDYLKWYNVYIKRNGKPTDYYKEFQVFEFFIPLIKYIDLNLLLRLHYYAKEKYRLSSDGGNSINVIIPEDVKFDLNKNNIQIIELGPNSYRAELNSDKYNSFVANLYLIDGYTYLRLGKGEPWIPSYDNRIKGKNAKKRK
jgi:hypothetical protein